ncbi:MAG: HNH endonuclease, partial [Desulfobacteraceae bacterium]|nr:HNH endonuclease [Desulfobacteraceae bacterium]
EFRNICNTRASYPGTLDTPKMRSVLAELELALRKEVKTEDPFGGSLNQLDIDHITPKSWFSHWPLQDGSNVNHQEFYMMERKVLLEEPLDEREKLMIERHSLIHTLGNLTLLNLSVNRSAQNKSFAQKKELLLQNTNLRLNISLLGLTTWDESEIKKRGNLLSEIAIKIWPGIKAESSVEADQDY